MGKGLAQRYTYDNFERDREIDEFKFTLPKPPPKDEIDGFGLKKEDQRFTPPTAKQMGEISYKMNNDDKLSKEDIDFIDLQWERRELGYWFYNNGNLEYITGLHYYYLTAWNIIRIEPTVRRDGSIGKRKISGLPTFTDSDRDYFYIWRETTEDDNCFGLIHITNRRDGKTYRATATLNELISRSPDSTGGIQSKTDTDGGKVFKKLVKSWQRLPEYFKPVDVGDSDPSKKIEYRNPKKRSTKTQKKEYSQVLGSEINYGNSKETFYDGDGLAIILHDEIGKTESADVWERWDIVKECLADGADVTGKAILTTTVEEMEKKGGANCKKIWDESDSGSDTFKTSKQTISGLKRYFKPAYYGLRGADKSEDGDETPDFIDGYGYSDVEAAEKYLIKIEKTLTGEKLISRKRKYPRDIKDAFMVSGKTESLPVAKIYEQKEFNESLPPSVTTRGNFVWEDMNQHIVKFYEDPKGFFEISWMPEVEQRNRFSYDARGYPKPLNTILGNIGVDPFDHKVTVSTKKSDAAAQLFRRFNIDSPMNSNGFIFNYVGRRSNPDDFYEDMIMAGVFFGVQVFSENQKPGLNNHMTRRGYQNYIKKTKQSDYTKSTSKTSVEGVSMAGKLVRDQSINGLVTYIYKFIGKISIEVQMEEFGWKKEDCLDDLYGNCPFDSLLDDWLKFDADNWTISDQTVSSMISILGVTPIRNNRNDGKEREVKIDLSKLFQSQRTKF